MKKELILSIIAVALGVAALVLSLTGNKAAETTVENGKTTEVTAAKGDIVFIDLDVILQQYDMANDLRSVVETKISNIQAEVNRRAKKLEGDVNAFQEKINKGLMTRSVAEAQGQKLQQQEIDFNNYAAQKQNEINEEQVVMMNQLADAIQTFLDKYNEEKQYAMIITNQGGAPVITGDAALDITEDVLNGLNEEYIKTKKENK